MNDEIRLKKWLEDKEKEEEERDRKRGGGREKEKEKERERTASGIDGWYLRLARKKGRKAGGREGRADFLKPFECEGFV